MKLLVVGSGVSGTALASLLVQRGHTVVLAESGPRAASGGYAINLCPRALEILRRMNVFDDIWQRRIPIHQITMMDNAGARVRSDDLSRVSRGEGEVGIYVERGVVLESLRRCLDGVDVRYDCSLTGLECHEDKVRARLSDQSEREFDGVVAADGLHSTVSRLVFDAPDVVDLGVSFAFVRAPNVAKLPVETYNLSGIRKMCGVTGLSEHEVGVLVFWYTADEPIAGDMRVRDLRRLCEGFGFSIPETLASLPELQEIYSDRMVLIRHRAWSNGRVALLGDAAHCTSPLSTMGAAAALAGAYVLAKEIEANATLQAAYAAYERRLRPGIERIQKRTQQNVRRVLTVNERDAIWRNRILRLIPSGIMRSMMIKSQSDSIVSAL